MGSGTDVVQTEVRVKVIDYMRVPARGTSHPKIKLHRLYPPLINL